MSNDAYYKLMDDASLETQPLVSVVVPFRNAGAGFGDIVQGFLMQQTLRDFELLCVDDGSTDESAISVRRVACADDRVKLLSQEHKGAGAARNRGLLKSSGRFIIFLDADDEFYPNLLEIMAKDLLISGADVCMCGYETIDCASGRVRKVSIAGGRLNSGFYSVNDPEIDSRLFQITTNAPWNKMFKRELLIENDVRFQEIALANDAYFTAAALSCSHSIFIQDDVLVRYKINSGNSLIDKAATNSICPLLAAEAIDEHLSCLKMTDGRLRSLKLKCFELAYTSLMRSENSISWEKSYARCIEYAHFEICCSSAMKLCSWQLKLKIYSVVYIPENHLKDILHHSRLERGLKERMCE